METMYYDTNTHRQRSNARQRSSPYQQPPYSRQQAPPRSTSSRSRQQQRRSTSSRPMDRKKQLLVLSGSLISLAVWYLTPVSDYVVDILLLQVPLEADIDLGREAAKEYKAIYHPQWTPLMESIGQDLVRATPRHTHYQWDFGVLKDPTVVNAFALPGGVIRVTTGLLEQLKLTEGELAALIGHEMGHVLHRHSQARLLQQQVLATVLQALFYKDEDPHQETFGEAIGELLLNSADWLGRQSFSRSNEYEADAMSWKLLTSGRKYNPQALSSLLNKLWEYHGRQGGNTSWESTHPGTLDRIGALEERWNALTYRERRKLTSNTIR